MGSLELVVRGDVDVVCSVGVAGQRANVCSRRAVVEFLEAQSGESDRQAGLGALVWRERGLEYGFEGVDGVVVPCVCKVGSEQVGACVVNGCVVVVIA